MPPYELRTISDVILRDRETGEALLQAETLTPTITSINKPDSEGFTWNSGKEINITFDSNTKFSKEFVDTFIIPSELPENTKVMLKPIPYKSKQIMQLLGFQLYHVRKSKSVRIQKKLDKKYGYVGFGKLKIEDKWIIKTGRTNTYGEDN